jgi:hypothetical protein
VGLSVEDDSAFWTEQVSQAGRLTAFVEVSCGRHAGALNAYFVITH